MPHDLKYLQSGKMLTNFWEQKDYSIQGIAALHVRRYSIGVGVRLGCVQIEVK